MSVSPRPQRRTEAESEARHTGLVSLVFAVPRVRRVESETAPIRAIVLSGASSLVKREKVVTISGTVSDARRLVTRIGRPAKTPAFPRWSGWYERDNAIRIGDVINLIIKYMFPGTRVEPTDFTDKRYLGEQFKVARQLYNAVRSRDELKSVLFVNAEGGVDIYSSVKSYTDPDKRYYQVISVGRGEDGKPVVRATCSCPTSGTICKHLVAAIAAHIPEIYGAVHALGKNEPHRLHEYIDMYRRRQASLVVELERLSREYDSVWEAYIYYMVKFLKNIGVLRPYKLDKYSVESYTETVRRVLETGRLPPELAGKGQVVEKREVVVGTEYTIEWPDEMRRMQDAVEGLIKDLQARFGRRGGRLAWARMLAFAMVMSADYTKAPIVLHAVGDIGTFKTSGAKLLAKYVKIPELVVQGKGEPRTTYEEILGVVSRHLGVPASALMNKVGGLVSSVARKGSIVEVGFNLAYVLSLLASRGSDGLAAYNALLAELKRRFNVSYRLTGATVDVKDHMQLARIENYRFTYVPDEKLGLLTKSDVFDNYVLVIDEGSRNPDALEGMLTKMSVAGLTEGVRVIIVTDNLEPHIEMVRNPRYAPLYDRMFLVFTSGVVDELTVMENLFREPGARFDAVALLATARFIEAIPVSEEKVYLTKAVADSLSYTFTLKAAPDGSKFLAPLRRGEKAPIVIDVYQGAGEFDFYPGGRFTVHTLLLSKFNAFLRGGDRVEDRDVKSALSTTVASRLVVDASTYSEYKARVLGIAARVREVYDEMRSALPRVAEMVALLRDGKYDEASALFQELVSLASEEPVYAPLLMSALELYAALNDVDLDSLPRPIAYTIAEILLLKGDTDALEGTRTLSELMRLRGEEA